MNPDYTQATIRHATPTSNKIIFGNFWSPFGSQQLWLKLHNISILFQLCSKIDSLSGLKTRLISQNSIFQTLAKEKRMVKLLLLWRASKKMWLHSEYGIVLWIWICWSQYSNRSNGNWMTTYLEPAPLEIILQLS